MPSEPFRCLVAPQQSPGSKSRRGFFYRVYRSYDFYIRYPP